MSPPNFNFKEHEAMVREFLIQKKLEDEQKYEEVCIKYPVQTFHQHRRTKLREIPVGLLGVAPSRISVSIAGRNDMESSLLHSGESE